MSDGSLYPLSVPHTELGKLGLGVGMYFNLIVVRSYIHLTLQFYMAIFVGGVALLNIPLIIDNANGSSAMNADQRLSFPGNVFSLLSLANQPAGISIFVFE
jgi:hypothetical protein